MVSIIIPTFNRANCIEKAINSVLNQTYTNWELLIIDNYSNDQTEKIILSYNNPKIFFKKIKNNGVIAVSRNYGALHANGKYLAFLDSDDYWLPKKLEISLQYLEENFDFIYHDLYITTGSFFKNFLSGFYVRSRNIIKPAFSYMLKNGNPIVTSSVVLRKSLFNKINGFSEEVGLIAGEDFDAWLRFAKISENFKRIKVPLGFYSYTNGNLSSPGKTIIYLNRLKDLYFNENKNLPIWFNYSISRAFYLKSNYINAIYFSKNAIFKNKNIILQIKSIYIYSISHLKLFINVSANRSK